MIFHGFPPGVFLGIRPSFFFFYSINKELPNSNAAFSFFTTQQKGKEEELDVYYRLDFILVLVLFFGFESVSCAETSRAGFLVLLFLFSIASWKFMKSRKISIIHFFSVLLQLQWLCVIGTPFLDSQCNNQNAALLDLIYI